MNMFQSLCCWLKMLVVVVASAGTTFAQSLVLNSGAITINTDTLTISGSASATGTLVGGVANFNFGTINLGSGVNVTLLGSNPLALNAIGNITIGTTLDASGGNGGNNSGAIQGLGGVGILGGGNGGIGGHHITANTAGDGFGPGGGQGQNSCCFGGGGGSFGGLGGVSGGAPGADQVVAGPIYGDAALSVLQGGSGGGGGGGCCVNASTGSGGGAGGGAISLFSEFGNIHITSTGEIIVDGGNANNLRTGGGGSGGAIKLDAGNLISIDGLLSADGGIASTTATSAGRAGGSGGGGRIALFAAGLELGGNPILVDGMLTSNAFLTVVGGPGSNVAPNSSAANSGDPGTILFTTQDVRTPEPASVAIWSLLALGMAVAYRFRLTKTRG